MTYNLKRFDTPLTHHLKLMGLRAKLFQINLARSFLTRLLIYDSSLGETCNEGICLDVSKFREHLKYLKDSGYKTLTMYEFMRWMYGEIELPAKSVLITVDDGAMGTGKHNGNKLIPILEEYNMICV